MLKIQCISFARLDRIVNMHSWMHIPDHTLLWNHPMCINRGWKELSEDRYRGMIPNHWTHPENLLRQATRIKPWILHRLLQKSYKSTFDHRSVTCQKISVIAFQVLFLLWHPCHFYRLWNEPLIPSPGGKPQSLSTFQNTQVIKPCNVSHNGSIPVSCKPGFGNRYEINWMDVEPFWFHPPGNDRWASFYRGKKKQVFSREMNC